MQTKWKSNDIACAFRRNRSCYHAEELMSLPAPHACTCQLPMGMFPKTMRYVQILMSSCSRTALPTEHCLQKKCLFVMDAWGCAHNIDPIGCESQLVLEANLSNHNVCHRCIPCNDSIEHRDYECNICLCPAHVSHEFSQKAAFHVSTCGGTIERAVPDFPKVMLCDLVCLVADFGQDCRRSACQQRPNSRRCPYPTCSCFTCGYDTVSSTEKDWLRKQHVYVCVVVLMVQRCFLDSSRNHNCPKVFECGPGVGAMELLIRFHGPMNVLCDEYQCGALQLDARSRVQCSPPRFSQFCTFDDTVMLLKFHTARQDTKLDQCECEFGRMWLCSCTIW